ncbi:MAG: hypothetical protein L0221_08735, partial [Chloroflexi bacterium]|nr:hypothetical protein [Chloroflexota bacterium]
MLPDVRRRLADVDRPSAARSAVVVAVGIASGTIVVGLLQAPYLGIGDASPVYFVVVVLVGAITGTLPAIATAGAAFLAYNFLF